MIFIRDIGDIHVQLIPHFSGGVKDQKLEYAWEQGYIATCFLLGVGVNDTYIM